MADFFAEPAGTAPTLRANSSLLFPGRLQGAISKSPTSRAHLRGVLAQRRGVLASETLTPSTAKIKLSHYSYWEEFATNVGICTYRFAADPDPSLEVLAHEEDALIAFLIYVSEYPRSAAKRNRSGSNEGRNSIRYAGDVVSSARLWYEARRGGPVGRRSHTGVSSAHYLGIKKALAKRQPAARPPRQPILPQHMRLLFGQVDMSSHMDRTCWCLALSCWVGVRRVGDWLAETAEAAQGWRPRHRSHRGRISLETQPSGYTALKVLMKPPKEDITGSRTHEAVFATDVSGTALSAGNAWRTMLEADDEGRGANPSTIPIFRHLPSGTEISKLEFKQWIAAKFNAAGLTHFGTRSHSLRIGGATTLAELAGDTAARGVGSWLSSSMLLYLHMSTERKLRLGELMARGNDVRIGADSHPIGRRS